VLNSAKEVSLNMGYLNVNEKTDIPLFFTNTSPFLLSVACSLRNIISFNPNSTIPFYLAPSKFTIPAQGKVDCIAGFTPGCEGRFSADLHVEFGGPSSTKIIHLSGFGCEKGMYVVFPDEENLTVFAPRKDIFAAFGDLQMPVGASVTNPHIIQFKSSGQKAIVVGNNKGSNGEVSVEGFTDAESKQGWRVEPLKSAVAAGTRSTIGLWFNPTSLLFDSLPLPGVGVVSLCNIRLVLKGGTPLTEQTIYLRLKGVACR
jgi:hypothetical protein